MGYYYSTDVPPIPSRIWIWPNGSRSDLVYYVLCMPQLTHMLALKLSDEIYYYYTVLDQKLIMNSAAA